MSKKHWKIDFVDIFYNLINVKLLYINNIKSLKLEKEQKIAENI